MKIEEANTFSFYTSFKYTRMWNGEIAFVILAHKSPNGQWWSTYKNPVTLDELDGISESGEWTQLTEYNKGVPMINWQQAIEEVLLLTYNYEGVKIWLQTPNNSLQNRVPQNMIDQGYSEEVYDLAESLTGMIAT